MALAGWLTHTLFLAALSNEYIPMAPATAICFLLIASAMSLEASHNAEAARYVITASAVLVALFCLIVLLQFAAHPDFDVESVFLHKSEFRSGIPLGRMSSFTASGIFAAALAIFFLTPFFRTSQKRKDLGGILGFITCLLGLVLLLGYVYGSPIFYHVGIPVSLTTALGFMLIGAGIIVTARPESVPLRLFVGESSHARILRLFMPVLFLSLVFNAAADILVIQTTENRGLAIAFSTISFFLIICGVFIVISRRVSRMLDRSMEEQRESGERIRQLNLDLVQRNLELERLSYKSQLILESAGEGICGVNKQGVVTFINKAAADMLGYAANELIGKHSHSQWHYSRPDGTPYPSEECPIYATYKDGDDHIGEEVFRRKDGTSITVDFTSKPIFEEDDIVGAVVTFRDITARKKAEESISELAAIVESSDDAIIGQSLDGMITSWNSGAEKLYGYTKEEAVGNSISLLVPPDHPEQTLELLEQIREGKRVDHYDTVRIKKNGDLIYVSITISPVKDYTGRIVAASAIFRDITEKKKTEEVLRHLSTMDGLTGIANRRAFDIFLDEEWKRALRSKYQVTILMVDVDFFKNYNDTYGHLQGDECLKSVVAILKSAARRPGDMAARFGGEEFVVFLSTADTEHAVSIAEKIRRDIEALEMPHERSEISSSVTVSIGVVSAVPDPNMSANDFLQCADEALYKGKEEGRNRVAFKELAHCRLAPSPH